MTGDEVSVHLNRNGPGSITVAPADEPFETRRSFVLVVENHGEPAHVHCRVEGDLADVATVGATNPYADPEAPIRIHVRVEPVERAVEGTLELATGYGKATTSLPVTVEPPGGDTPPVQVDESLSKPQTDGPDAEDAPAIDVGDVDPGTLGLVALGVVAVGIAAMGATVVGGTAAAVGLIVVTAGILAALSVLLR